MQYPMSHEVEETVRGRRGQQVGACRLEGEGHRAAGAPGQEGGGIMGSNT